MKIWEQFKEYLRGHAVNGNLFYTRFTLPKTCDEKYWYNIGLQDSITDLRDYEIQCDAVYSKKYDSLVRCLARKGIQVCYDENTGITHINQLDLRSRNDLPVII